MEQEVIDVDLDFAEAYSALPRISLDPLRKEKQISEWKNHKLFSDAKFNGTPKMNKKRKPLSKGNKVVSHTTKTNVHLKNSQSNPANNEARPRKRKSSEIEEIIISGSSDEDDQTPPGRMSPSPELSPLRNTNSFRSDILQNHTSHDAAFCSSVHDIQTDQPEAAKIVDVIITNYNSDADLFSDAESDISTTKEILEENTQGGFMLGSSPQDDIVADKDKQVSDSGFKSGETEAKEIKHCEGDIPDNFSDFSFSPKINKDQSEGSDSDDSLCDVQFSDFVSAPSSPVKDDEIRDNAVSSSIEKKPKYQSASADGQNEINSYDSKSMISFHNKKDNISEFQCNKKNEDFQPNNSAQSKQASLFSFFKPIFSVFTHPNKSADSDQSRVKEPLSTILYSSKFLERKTASSI